MARAKEMKDTIAFVTWVKDIERDSEYVNDIHLYTLNWRIGNYSMIKPSSKALTSPVFTVGPDKDMTLNFCLLPINDTVLKIEVSLGKCYAADCNRNERLSRKIMRLSFLDSNRKPIEDLKLPFECKYVNTSKYYVWKMEEDISRFLHDDTLNVSAKLSLRFLEVPDKNRHDCNGARSLRILLDDFKKLIDDKNLYADVLVKVGDRTFSAHKAILFSHCPHLEKLASICASESPNSSSSSPPTSSTQDLEILHLPNENADDFLAVLHYIYCAKIYATDAVNDFGVYHFAKKYNLRELSLIYAPAEMEIDTRMNIVKVDFTWIIKNFSSRSKNAFEQVASPIFKTNAGKEIEWNVLMYVFDSENIFLSLQRRSACETDVYIIFKLSVYSDDGFEQMVETDCREFKHLFTQKTVSSCYPGFLDAESRFVIDSKFLHKDTLTVRCELTLPDGDTVFERKNTHPGEYSKIDLDCWVGNFKNILSSGFYSDATLKVDEETYQVHKPILAARSPVFSRMFENEMTEKLSGCVEIADVSSSVMEIALSYIYTGKLTGLDMDSAIELYRVADKYDIRGLKEECSNFISENIEGDAACRILILADLFNDERLRTIAKNCVCRRASQALLSSQGQELINCYSHLAHDILDSLSDVFCSLPPQDTSEKDTKLKDPNKKC